MEEEETVPGQLGSNPHNTELPDTSKPDNSSASSSAEQMNTAGVSTATRGANNIHAVDVSWLVSGASAVPDSNYTTAAHDDATGTSATPEDTSSKPGPFNAAGISVAKDFDTGTPTTSQGEHTLSFVALVVMISDNSCVQVQNQETQSFIP